ncbi:MAG TPA: hypothetical protein VNM41_01875 [Solirubrobacterales bacterium]|nr:hypothetical protein [Solirubrobacterales bacterium]
MHVTMVKEAWTDERLDDLSKGVGEVRAEVIELRKEVGHVREELGELRSEIKGLKTSMGLEIKGLKETMDARFEAVDRRFDDLIRTMQIGFSLTGAVLVALIGLIATQL